MVVLNRMPVVLTLLLAMATTAFASDPDLELALGRLVPPLPDKVEWISDPPDTQGSMVRLLLFWDPSYTGSRMAVPIMSQLQERWGTDRLQILGYGVEKPQTTNYNERAIPTVEPWVHRHAMRIKFPVGSVTYNDMNRSWLRKTKRDQPILVLFVIGPHGRLQGVTSPLDESVNELVSKLITGRYDVQAEEWAGPYRLEIENYRRNRDWTQYKFVVDRMNKFRGEEGGRFFVQEELDFLVSALTEQDDPQLAERLVQRWIMERSDSDPDFLGMLAERLANDPTIPDDRRMLSAAAKAAKSSYDSADTAEDRARALGRMALVNTRQGNPETARQQAKQAYRIAPPHIKSELKERWLYVKQRTGDGV